MSARTRARYIACLARFLQFAATFRLACSDSVTLDSIMAEYIEELWKDLEPLYWASYAVAGLAWLLPNERTSLGQSWRLIRIWEKNSPPVRASPFVPLIVLGLAGLAADVDAYDLVALFLVGFDGFLRTGELFSLTVDDVRFVKDSAILRIKDSKTGQRLGQYESLVVRPGVAVRWLKRACQGRQGDERLLRRTPQQARQLLVEFLRFFGLHDDGFGFYSLRRGGATSFFMLTQSMEATLVRGRWAATRTARLYISAMVAESVALKFTSDQRALLSSFARRLVEI